MITATELIWYMNKLENSRATTIEEFMFFEVSMEWESNPTWVELADMLKATMVLHEGWWISK